MNSKISVIVPFYNINKLALRRCIDSILRQSYRDFELIIVNDGSSKNYEDIEKEYLEKDNRIIFIRNEHAGVSAARNKGIEVSKGEYIAFVDSDDYVEENYLSTLYNAIQDSDIAIGAVLVQNYWTYHRWEDRRLFFSQPSRYNGLQYINFCWNKLYKSRIIKDNNIKFEESVKLGEDALFLNEYYKYCETFRSVKSYLYFYEYNYNSAVNKYDLNFWNWEQKVIQVQWDLFHQYPLSDIEEQAMLSWLYRKFKYVLYYYIDRESDKNQRSMILKNVVSHPLFEKLKECKLTKENVHFNSNDCKILKIWSNLGINGIYLTRLIAKYK